MGEETLASESSALASRPGRCEVQPAQAVSRPGEAASRRSPIVSEGLDNLGADGAPARLGIMGGTFDPIHIGHLILGENAWHQFGLEKVLFMPSANPPHKPNRIGRADIQERVDMVRGAIADNPHFELSLEEAFREDYCYTSETLQEMTVKHPDTEYYFIMGADSLFAFETWHEPQKICQNCVIVATPNIDVSSHEIREWIRKANTSLKYYVPDKVISYIKEKNLYSECKE